METFAHQRLKDLAIRFLRAEGCLALSTEVRCPISRYRIDAAGYLDSTRSNGDDPRRHRRRTRRRCEPTTIIVECKQARADFLRDNEQRDPLLEYRRGLQRIRESIEEHRIKEHEPQLRQSGTALFADLEEWDFASSRLPSYRRVVSQLRMVDKKLHGQTKFHLIAQYKLADRLYLAAPRGMIKQAEVPPGWGLLQCPPAWLDPETVDKRLDESPQLEIVIEAPLRRGRDEHRLRLLRNIAVAASFAAQRARPATFTPV